MKIRCSLKWLDFAEITKYIFIYISWYNMESPVIAIICWSWKLFNFIIRFVFLFIANTFDIDMDTVLLSNELCLLQTFFTQNDFMWPYMTLSWPKIWKCFHCELTVFTDNTSLNSTWSKSECSIEFIKQLIVALNDWAFDQSADRWWIGRRLSIGSIFRFALEIQEVICIYRHWYRHLFI